MGGQVRQWQSAATRCILCSTARHSMAALLLQSIHDNRKTCSCKQFKPTKQGLTLIGQKLSISYLVRALPQRAAFTEVHLDVEVPALLQGSAAVGVPLVRVRKNERRIHDMQGSVAPASAGDAPMLLAAAAAAQAHSGCTAPARHGTG